MKKPRGILLAGNWKMNQGPQATERFFSELKSKFMQLQSKTGGLKQGELEICIFPPSLSIFTALKSVSPLPFPIHLGAQNVHWEKNGAFTGEISGPMLKEIGIPLALVGHSERRQYFGETDATARKRTESLLGQDFRVILCVGETREQRDSGKTEAVLLKQLGAVLPGAHQHLDGRLVIAYEPIWAIGTGLTATTVQAEEAHQMIRKFLWDSFGLQAAGKTRILYGGSVTSENIQSLLDCPNVDGALIGGASLKPENWITFMEAALASL